MNDAVSGNPNSNGAQAFLNPAFDFVEIKFIQLIGQNDTSRYKSESQFNVKIQE